MATRISYFIPYFLIFWGLFNSALAQPYLVPDPLPGWTHSEELRSDTDAKHGVILPGKQIIYSSPVIAEVDGDESTGKEVVVAGADGIVYVLRADGSLLWSRQIANCQAASPRDRIYSSPAVGALLGDGVPYVVIGYGGIRQNGCPGGVFALKGSDGSVFWHFNLKKFKKQQKFFAIHHGVFSSPALADVDGDGKLEVGFGSFDRNVYLLNSRGKVIWYYLAADTVWSSPIFANIDSDPDLEMIIGTDISANKYLNPPTKNGGYLYALKTTPRSRKLINFRDSSAYLWQVYFDQVIFGTPAIGDIIPDNPGDEIVVGTGCYFPEGTNNKNGKWFKVLSAATGAVLRTLPIPACSPSSPALADVDDDGVLEVIVTTSGSRKLGGPGQGKLMVWDADLDIVKWEVVPKFAGANDTSGGDFQSPIVADIDGNGSLEILIAHRASVAIFAADTGSALTCQTQGCLAPGVVLPTFQTLKATPAVGDIDGDGVLDLVIGGGHNKTNKLAVVYAWTNFSAVLSSPSGLLESYFAPWPMFKRTPERAG